MDIFSKISCTKIYEANKYLFHQDTMKATPSSTNRPGDEPESAVTQATARPRLVVTVQGTHQGFTSPASTANEGDGPEQAEQSSEASVAVEALTCLDEQHKLEQVEQTSIYATKNHAMSTAKAQKIAAHSLAILVNKMDFLVDGENEFPCSGQNFLGQVGLVRDDEGTARFVTCKHILVQKRRTENQETLVRKTLIVKLNHLPSLPSPVVLCFPDATNHLLEDSDRVVLRHNRTWSYGIDVAWGETLEARRERAVRTRMEFPDLEPIVFNRTTNFWTGTKIGIAVYSDRVPNLKSVKTQENETQVRNGTINLRDYFGPANSVTIYSGEIDYVGPHHIEYSMNTFKGCSGAIIFLLDSRGEPTSTGNGPNDWAPCAIGVHAGYHPDMNTNIGFKFPACGEAEAMVDNNEMDNLVEGLHTVSMSVSSDGGLGN
jgi:hypothetical protein